VDTRALADQLLRACDDRTTIPLLSETVEGFDVPSAYEVLSVINDHRRDRGWKPVGWKIGFTNRTLWPRYDVWQPMWAPVWDRTLHMAPGGTAALDLGALVQPRIETEVVFCLRSDLPATDDARTVLEHTEWIAAGFEIVQSHFAGWRFSAADCTAAFGLHGALVVGRPLVLTGDDRARLLTALAHAEVTLRRGDDIIDRGISSVVLDSPALALAHLSRCLAAQGISVLLAGDIITTGTITDAWPVTAGETWTSDYGLLGIDGLTLTFTSAE
jgi:2-oxo-3-hexenedioate decarboxylase